MKLVVSSHAFLLVVELDEQWRITDCQKLAEGYHFGVVATELQGEHHLLAYHDTRFAQGETVRCLRSFVLDNGRYRLANEVRLDGSWSDIHQITPEGAGFYVANTGRNSLVWCDQGFNIVHEHRFEGKSHDYNHINSVFVCGDHVLAMLHNKSYKTSELAVFQRDATRPFQLLNTLSLWHTCSHNVYVQGTRLMYNASVGGALVSVDLAGDRIAGTLPFDCGHNKGLSVTRDALLIGLSEHAPRSQRGKTSGSLLVLDRNSLREIASVSLRHPALDRPCGNINEVRCLSEPDLALRAETPADVDWTGLKLAKREPVRHTLRQTYLKTTRPLRTLKKKIQSKLS